MRKAAAAVMALLFLGLSAWTFVNEDRIEAWLPGQVAEQATTAQNQLPLQDNETWLVVVVDFPEHRADNGWGPDEATTMLDQAVIPYIDQLSGGQTNLTIVVHDTVIRATKPLASYGSDGSGKDTATDGTFLPVSLAEEAVLGVRTSVDWSDYDLDNDGTVDRFMVLHTTKGQEENPGNTNRIWSHYTQFQTPIDVGDGLDIAHYTMASLQTGTSGIGTIVHEMLHQMGAVDLYPVHDEVNSQSWKGPGDWDIMASGNWNGGGRWPAMPTGANVELVRPERVERLDLVWPSTTTRPCIGPSITLSGITEGGSVLKIPIAEHENVFIEHRSDSGYDSRLPGNGILVSYQDLSVGDVDRNEVNTNPNTPWLRVIEADEGADLVRGSNQGEASDLFLNNTTFGAEGVEIRTHDGVLVPWVGEVSGEENLTVAFRAPNCIPSFTVDMTDHGSTVLPNEAPYISISGDVSNCTSTLTSSDGRGITLVQNEDGYAFQYTSAGVAPSTATLRGEVMCGNDAMNIEHTVHVLNRIPVPSTYDARIHPQQPTRLQVPIDSVGEGEQRYDVTIDGPLARVASGEPFITLVEGGTYTLEIEPNGLLTENMLVYGTVQLRTEEGMSWTIDVELQASTVEPTWWMIWTEPGRVISLMLLLLGCSTLAGVIGSRPKTRAEHQHQDAVEVQTDAAPAEDAWGRPLDDESTNAFDVQEG